MNLRKIGSMLVNMDNVAFLHVRNTAPAPAEYVEVGFVGEDNKAIYGSEAVATVRRMMDSAEQTEASVGKVVPQAANDDLLKAVEHMVAVWDNDWPMSACLDAVRLVIAKTKEER